MLTKNHGFGVLKTTFQLPPQIRNSFPFPQDYLSAATSSDFRGSIRTHPYYTGPCLCEVKGGREGEVSQIDGILPQAVFSKNQIILGVKELH